MNEHANMLRLLEEHFDLNKYEVNDLPSPNQLHVRISLEIDKYNDEHFWYRWDYLCSKLPNLHGGSWKVERSSSDGFDHFDFTVVFPSVPISESQ